MYPGLVADTYDGSETANGFEVRLPICGRQSESFLYGWLSWVIRVLCDGIVLIPRPQVPVI